MSMLYVMVPAALALAVTALVAFVWAVKSGQFDDPQASAYRMLFEDEPVSRADDAEGESDEDSHERTDEA